jgi:hypothetical protein
MDELHRLLPADVANRPTPLIVLRGTPISRRGLVTEKHCGDFCGDPTYKLEHFGTSQQMFVHSGKRLEIFGLQAILSRICELLKTLL